MPVPLDAGCKLNAHKSYILLLNVLFTFNLRPFSRRYFGSSIFFFRSFQGSWTLRSFLMVVSSGVILPLCFLRISSLASLNAASMAFYSVFIIIVSISHALRVLVNRAKRLRFSLIHTKLRSRLNFT